MAEMARDVFTTIRYDGSDLSGHEIDVQELAPALLALAEMIQATNRKFNGDDISMKVLVKADIEQQCFQLQIHIVQSLLDAAKHLFTTEQYKTAREIAELLDLVLPAGVGGGVFWAWKRIWGTKEEQEKPLSSYEIQQHGGTTVINNFYGDGANLEMPTGTFELATDPEMIRLGKRVLKPLEKDGYDSLGFYQGDKPVVEYNDTEAARVTKRAPDDADGFASGNVDEAPPEVGPQQVDGQVEIVTAQYVGNAQWGLRWLSKIRQMKMADEAWLTSYQADAEPLAIPGAWLDVHMEIEQVDGSAAASFTVTKVKRVIPPERQAGLFDGKSPPSA